MRQNVMDEGGHPYTHQSQSESRKWELYYYTPSAQFKITVKICNSVMFFNQMMNRCPFYGEFGGFARISRNLCFEILTKRIGETVELASWLYRPFHRIITSLSTSDSTKSLVSLTTFF